LAGAPKVPLDDGSGRRVGLLTTSTLRDEMAVSGLPPLAACGQMLLAAHIERA
jgi:hypothetical protein